MRRCPTAYGRAPQQQTGEGGFRSCHPDGARLRWDAVQADGNVQPWQAPLAADDARALRAQLDALSR